MLHRPSASRGRARSGVGMVAAGLLAGLALTATPAHADEIPAPPPAVEEFQPRAGVKTTYVQGSKNVTSTKRKKVKVSLGASRSSEAGLSVTLAQNDESHHWNFDMPAKNLAVNSKGAGSLRTKAAAPFGKIALKIVPKKSWNTTKCKGKVVSKTRPVTLKGAFFFNSDSAWGAVGSKRSFALNGTVTVYNGEGLNECSGGGGEPCPTTGASWFAYSGQVFLSGGSRAGSSTAYISGSRSVALPKPAGAYRYDFASAEVDAPDLVSGGDGSGTLRVETGTSGAKGTATLTAGSSFSSESTCKRVIYRSTQWSSAEFTNGGTPLALKMSAFSDLKLPDGSGGSFSRTVKATS